MIINALRKHVFDKISVQDLWKLSLFHNTIQNKISSPEISHAHILNRTEFCLLEGDSQEIKVGVVD